MRTNARKIAKELGSLIYNSGSSCSHGHTSPDRYTSNGKCVTCSSSHNTSIEKKEYDRVRYSEKREYVIGKVKRYRETNPEKVKLSKKLHKVNNLEKVRAYFRDYIKSNKSITNAENAKRRASKKKATPPWSNSWLEKLKIREQYIIAEVISTVTGVKHHVDHIVPLQSDVVCGLHCISNLRVIPASINMSKSNKLVEELL